LPILSALESNISHSFKNKQSDKIHQRFDQKILLYLFFVAISTFFWFLVKLGSDFNTVIKYPIEFTNIPGQKVVVNTLPDKLLLSVQASGFSILRYKVNAPASPLVIDMQRFSYQLSKKRTKEYNLLTRAISEEIKNQLPTDIELVSILPDTIPFIFSTIREKKVPIKPNVSLKFIKQSILDGQITFIPDSVTISGPDLILDTLKAVYTERMELTGLQKNVQKAIELKPIEGIHINIIKSQMQIPVSKYTEASVVVPIFSVNVPDSLVMKTIPNQVTIRYLVSLTNFSSISEADFRAEVDAKEIAGQLGQQLPVRLTILPAKAYEIKIIPEQVDFILEHKP
jgi:hypothetical protein